MCRFSFFSAANSQHARNPFCVFVLLIVVAMHSRIARAAESIDLGQSREAGAAQKEFNEALEKVRQSILKTQSTSKRTLVNDLKEAKTHYLWDLAKVQKLETKQGDLEAVIVVKKEMARIQATSHDSLTSDANVADDAKSPFAKVPHARAFEKEFNSDVENAHRRHELANRAMLQRQNLVFERAKRSYITSLKRAQIAETKAGKLELALKIRSETDRVSALELATLLEKEKIVAAKDAGTSNTDPNTTPTTPASTDDKPSPLASKSARINVRAMEPVALLQTEKGYLSVPPTLLKNKALIYKTAPNGKPGGVADIEVLESGLLIVACYYGYEGNNSGGWTETRWKKADFIANGWKFLSDEELGGKLAGQNNREYLLFSKVVKKGEALKLRCNKYGAPSPIVFR